MQLRPKHVLADTAAHDMALSDDLTAELCRTLARLQPPRPWQEIKTGRGLVERLDRVDSVHYDYEWSTSSC